MKIKCPDCETNLYLSQSDSWTAPVGICECGQGYYAIWTSNLGTEIRKVDSELILGHKKVPWGGSVE